MRNRTKTAGKRKTKNINRKEKEKKIAEGIDRREKLEQGGGKKETVTTGFSYKTCFNHGKHQKSLSLISNFN